MIFVRFLLTATMLSLSASVSSGEPKELQAPRESSPPSPDPVQSGETLEPEVTIIQKADATVEEYRINGKLYMIKVIPVVGKPYYLLDTDGDGVMEPNMSEIYSDFVIPQWILFSW